MNAPIFWHSGGHVMCAEGPLALSLARRLVSVCAEEEAAALPANVPRAMALRAVRETLRTALATAEAWRRAAGWDNPEAADETSA